MDAAAEFVEQHLIGVEDKPSIVENCMLTVSEINLRVTPNSLPTYYKLFSMIEC